MTGKTFALPDLGEGLTEAEIVQWHVSAGEHVVADQPLVSVETDKAVVEIPSPVAGIVAKLCAAIGDRLAVGDPLVEYEEGAHKDQGAIVGALAGSDNEIHEAAKTPAAHKTPGSGAVPVKASPAVRRFAREKGIDLAAVVPTGPGGTISREDVLQATGVVAPSTEGEALSGVRRAMAERMSAAHVEVVPATVTGWAEIDPWFGKTAPVPRLVRAVVQACRRVPALNAWYHGAAGKRELHDGVALGIAVDTEDGLFVPVLRGAEAKDADAVAAEVERLAQAVEARKIAPDELRGATITLSDFGAVAGIFAAMVVVPPQVAIVGAGRATRQVVAGSGGPAVRVMLPLSLTFDHRAVTGGEAGRFLAALIADLERAS